MDQPISSLVTMKTLALLVKHLWLTKKVSELTESDEIEKVFSLSKWTNLSETIPSWPIYREVARVSAGISLHKKSSSHRVLCINHIIQIPFGKKSRALCVLLCMCVYLPGERMVHNYVTSEEKHLNEIHKSRVMGILDNVTELESSNMLASKEGNNIPY